MLPRSILFVDHTAELGGAEIALVRLLGALDRSRFTPVVLLFSDGPLVGRLRALSVEVCIEPLARTVTATSRDRVLGSLLRPGALLAAIGHLGRVVKFMRSRPFDLVHTTSLKADLLGGLAARFAGRRLVWHLHDRLAADYLPRRLADAMRFLARWLPHRVLVNSQATLATLQPIDPRRVRVVYPGVPGELLARGGANAEAASGQVVGLVGRISPTKGQDVFVRAAASVLERFPRARFQIIGSALFGHEAYEREVRLLAAQLGAGQVEFLGFCEDVAGRIAALSILVHASPTPEPFGQVVVEAMAEGKPVVASKAGGIPEIVLDGETGYLVAPGDFRALAEKIVALLAEPEVARAMGERGRERVAARFTAAQMAREIEDFYETVISPQRGS
jgi:glycosyltransferase involved in cell wall biosynthesis